MKKLFILFATFIVFQDFGLSQGCLPQGITFSTQAEIDNFQTNYPGCTEIEGFVRIVDSQITDLNGLNVLTSIGDYIEISSNDLLTNLSGLENLTTINGYVWIGSNSSLTNIDGLSSLEYIGEFLTIKNNPVLSSIQGLNNLNHIELSLHIEGNLLLTSLIGLENVTELGDYLQISSNSLLVSLDGLNNVNSVAYDITIDNNDNLINLNGLENITSIGDYLYVNENDELISLVGIDNINANTITDLFITNNQNLSTCEIQSICDYLAAPGGSIEIFNNSVGCNSQIEVEEACESVDIIEYGQEVEISIFPNPATDIITVGSKSESLLKSLRVFNQLGQKVVDKHKPFENIDISKLDQGIYIVEIELNEIRIHKKLIIE